MAIRTYISITALNVNGLNALTQTGWMDTKTRPIYMVSIRNPLQSDLKTHIDWKWEDEKIYSMQMGSKKKKME